MRLPPRIRRVLPAPRGPTGLSPRHIPANEPRQVQRTIIDFRSLALPRDVQSALADAFWNHVGPRQPSAVTFQWHHLKVFGRFVAETHSVRRLADLDRSLLLRYIEWLGQQRTAAGRPWSKSTRNVTYTVLRKLLQWIERCRPGVINSIEYPYNPFPWRRRDTQPRKRLSPAQIRAILRACEKDIQDSRDRRLRTTEERRIARDGGFEPLASHGALLEYIDAHCGGIIPSWKDLLAQESTTLRQALTVHGGSRALAACLYPTGDAIFPYYVAILIHAAGNPESMLALSTECLRPVPLLDDREMLVWEKHRAKTLQRRAFRRDALFEPPVLVREILEWTSRLRHHAPTQLRSRLLLYKAPQGVTALKPGNLVALRQRFVRRHRLPDFELGAIRPSVLTAFYRASGDLGLVKSIANHAQLSTTVAYVGSPEVEAQNRIRVATLQNAFLGYVRDPSAPTTGATVSRTPQGGTIAAHDSVIPPGEAISMFGFSCKDPFSGVAAGTRAGELCTNFLGCLTCPNAIVTHDQRTLARLLQARDHLRVASCEIHPARWVAIYAPQLHILEQDILARFSAEEIGEAQRLSSTLPDLPPLR